MSEIAAQVGIRVQKVRHNHPTDYARSRMHYPKQEHFEARVRSVDVQIPGDTIIYRSTRIFVSDIYRRTVGILRLPVEKDQTFETKQGTFVEALTIEYMKPEEIKEKVAAYDRWHKRQHK